VHFIDVLKEGGYVVRLCYIIINVPRCFIGVFFWRKRMNGAPFIIIASLLWSLDGILRRGLYSLPPTVVVFYEHFLGAIILLPVLLWLRKDLKNMTKKEWISITIVALFSGALGTIAYTAALGMVQYIQFSVVVLLQQLQPIWAILAASILLKEKISKKFALWAGVAIIASYFVTFRDLHVNISAGNGTLIAAGLALFAGFVWAVSTSFSKIVLSKVSFMTATALRFWIAPIFALLFIMAQGQTAAMVKITQAQWLSLLAITFSTGMLALSIYYFGLKKVPARISAICELTWPASAIFIDYFMYKQTLTLTQILGVAILFISMYQVTKFQK
jgi:drug/metabolite transporter (DMT)-like permease